MSRLLRFVPLAGLLAIAACANLGQYVWVDNLPRATPQPGLSEYLLAPGDTVAVRVFNQDSVSGRVRVRPDGMITVPLVNDVEAAGHTTRDLAQRLTRLLKDYLNQPVVTVSLEEVGPANLSVLGKVSQPGVYQVARGESVLRALAAAGGLTAFAHRDRIFVVRRRQAQRIRFSLDELGAPGSKAAQFGLEDDDVILVQ